MGNEGRERLATSWDAEGCLCIASVLPGPLQKGQKTRAERGGQGKWEMNALTQAGSNTRGATKPLLNNQLSTRLANKKHYGSLINQPPLQAVKEMEQSMMTSLPGRGGGRKNQDHWQRSIILYLFCSTETTPLYSIVMFLLLVWWQDIFFLCATLMTIHSNFFFPLNILIEQP